MQLSVLTSEYSQILRAAARLNDDRTCLRAEVKELRAKVELWKKTHDGTFLSAAGRIDELEGELGYYKAALINERRAKAQ